MEGAGRDEEDVVRPHHPVLGLHGGALHHREEVALHPLARHVGPRRAAAVRGDLVDLVQEDDPHLLHPVEGLVDHLVHVDQLVQLVLQQDAARLGHGDGAALGLLGEDVLQHVHQVVVHPAVHAAPHGDQHVLQGKALRHLHLHLAVFQLLVLQELAELVAGALAPLAHLLFLRLHPAGAGHEDARLLHLRGGLRGLGAAVREGRDEEVEEALLHALLGQLLHVVLAVRAHHVDGHVHQVAHHRLHVAAHVAHLGELARLHLDEGRPREPRQPPRDLRLPHPGGADHDDVVGDDLLAQLVVHPLAPPAVAQGDGHRLLGLALPHDVLVQLRHDAAGGELVQPGLGLGRAVGGGLGLVGRHVYSA